MAEEDTQRINVSTDTLYALAMAAVFILAAFQTMQLSDLKQEIAAQKAAVNPPTGTGFTAQHGSAATSAGNTQQAAAVTPGNVPDMVGGC